MIDLDKTRTTIEEVAHWFQYHKKIEDSRKFQEFHNKAFENLLVIAARLFQHIDILDARGKKISHETLILPQRMRSDNELHVDGRRNVDE